MKMPSALRAAMLALAAFAGVTLSSAARADEGFVQLTIYKAGWVIGGSGGSGVLDFRGRRYRLSTGGLDYGFVFGGSKTVLRGRAQATSTVPPMWPASMARRVRVSRWAAARGRSC